jgi:hypothetical protein
MSESATAHRCIRALRRNDQEEVLNDYGIVLGKLRHFYTSVVSDWMLIRCALTLIAEHLEPLRRSRHAEIIATSKNLVPAAPRTAIMALFS